MIAALTATLLTASDPVAVALSSRWPGTEAVGPKIAGELSEALGRAGLTVLDDAQSRQKAKALKLPDPRTCKGVRSCVLKLAVALSDRAVVIGVDVGKLGDRLVVRLEVVRADSTEPLDTLEINTTMRGWSNDTVVAFTQFAKRLKELLEPRAAPPPQEPPAPPVTAEKAEEAVTDAPKVEPVPSLTPAPVAAVARPAAAPSRARTFGLATGGAGLVSLISGSVVLVLAFTGRNSIEATYSTDAAGHTVSSLMRAELDQRASAVNTQLVASAVVLALGAALIATAIALLL